MPRDYKMSHMTFTFKGVTQPSDFFSEIKSTGNKSKYKQAVLHQTKKSAQQRKPSEK